MLALVAVGDAAIVQRDGVLGVELDDLVEVLDRAVAVALGAVGDAAVVVGRDIVGIELDRLGEVGDGAVVVAAVVIARCRGCGTPSAKFGVIRMARSKSAMARSLSPLAR